MANITLTAINTLNVKANNLILMLLSKSISIHSFALVVLKKYLKILLFYVVAFSMLSAAVPLHSIVHEHYFVHEDNCGKGCKKHLKNYSKPCCTTSDAIFIGELPLKPYTFTVNFSATTLETVYNTDNYFQFFHRTRNKAPPVLS